MNEQRRPAREETSAELLVEDIAGLNLRGLRTLRDLFIRPRQVFRAARESDWGGRYTPSIRLVFSLLILMTLLRFLWASEDSLMTAVFQQSLVRAGLEPAVAEVETARVFNAYVTAFPVVVILLHFLAASLLRVWGAGERTATRVRLYFLAITPNMSISVIWLLFTPLMTLGTFLYWTGTLSVIALTLDASTAWRGGTGGETAFGRGWRAGLLALTSFIVTTFGNTAAFIGAQVVLLFIR